MEQALLSRRGFLGAAAVGFMGTVIPAANSKPDPLAFLVVSDTHYLADKENLNRLASNSGDVTPRLIDQLNKLPGTTIPEAAGGGTVLTPRGVLHPGDLIDTGDKTTGKKALWMQQTEWDHFSTDFGLTGKDGRLKYPVYEVHGNHDGPQGDGLIIDKIKERNKKRPGVGNISSNGLHYSWDWGSVHFVNLGIVVGADPNVKRKRRYNPADSLQFLIADLDSKVGKSGRPVIVTHHVDVLRYSLPADPTTDGGTKEWDACDVKAFHDALKNYNIAAIFHGHTHKRHIFRWDGTAKEAKTGIPVFNVDKAAHFAFEKHAFYYVEIAGGEMTVRECFSTDRWKTQGWTPQVWKA